MACIRSPISPLFGEKRSNACKTSVLQALHYFGRLAGKDKSSFANYERAPMTTMGQNNLSAIARGFWRETQNNWEVGYDWKENYSIFSPKLSLYARRNNSIKKVPKIP